MRLLDLNDLKRRGDVKNCQAVFNSRPGVATLFARHALAALIFFVLLLYLDLATDSGPKEAAAIAFKKFYIVLSLVGAVLLSVTVARLSAQYPAAAQKVVRGFYLLAFFNVHAIFSLLLHFLADDVYRLFIGHLAFLVTLALAVVFAALMFWLCRAVFLFCCLRMDLGWQKQQADDFDDDF